MLMKTSRHLLAGTALALAAAAPASGAVCTPNPGNPTVRFDTRLGVFDVRLCRADVQATVDNFLSYVADGSYTSTGFIHRSVSVGISIVQGGGFYVEQEQVWSVLAKSPTPLQLAGLSNLRGTIAMARTGELDSATSQWFINVGDNVDLDTVGGGYAVFGEVIAGMEIVDLIAAVPVWQFQAPFGELPLIDYSEGDPALAHFVYVGDVRVVPEPGASGLGGAALVTLAAMSRRRRGMWRLSPFPAGT